MEFHVPCYFRMLGVDEKGFTKNATKRSTKKKSDQENGVQQICEAFSALERSGKRNRKSEKIAYEKNGEREHFL